MKKSVSIIIPVFNDQGTLDGNIKEVNRIANKLFDNHELLIFDDHSADRTGEILDSLAKKNPKIKAFHNKKNMNVGYSYRIGIKLATKNYVLLLPGPDSLTMESLENYANKLGQANVVTSYTGNKESRLLYRLIISYLTSTALNLLFGLHLKYYFGQQMYKTSLVRKVKMTTNSFGIYPEILIQLIKAGHSYKEVPIVGLPETSSTTAFRIRNIVGIIVVVIRLFFEMHFKKVRLT